ncbi:BglG family transcription antiterminator [Olsenella profusa]|uniref:Phosphoenolpyruvate-dependent sugar PTS family porter, EIIA 2 component n=1 Tax=Olsenella profusa F0195 TaxID=1125712 RepID=U2T8D2_9ACTN|nr:BglG family transcription antiterminator [Olsenella profusa]ERL09274.1 phosphoenolpyruvate-dependent sugar PTS family porter, EIIA 2 component [Olsenella profusa F0195]
MDHQLMKCISIIRDLGVADAQTLSSRLGVTTRTVRTYVRRINRTLAGVAHIQTVRERGYRLVIDDEDAFGRLQRLHGATDRLPSTPQERVSYLADDLLMRNDWITLDELSESLFVSRTTVSSDLKQVEKSLTEFGLRIERRSHHGIRVVGPEMARRLCLASLVVGSEVEGSDSSKSSAMLSEIDECVSEVAREEDVQIRNFVYRNLLIHVAIAIERIRGGCYVPMERSQLQSIKRSTYFSTAQRMARALEERLRISLPEEEVAYIAIHLAGKETIEAQPSSDDGRLVIPEEVWDVVGQITDLVGKDFHFDLSDDLELRMNLARHIAPLSVRMLYHMQASNPILSDIKVHYPLAYHMALDCAPLLTQRWGSELSEDEVGYIALSFALALERSRTQVERKNVLMVCASGEGSARLLELRFRERFGNQVNRVETCDVSLVGSRDLSDIDYVITTVPIRERLRVPILEVGNFLEDADLDNIKVLLSRNATEGVRGYFPPELFLPHLDLSSREEAIDLLSKRVAEREGLGEELTASVWRREELATTAFGNYVAMPHPLETMGSRTVVCVGIAKREIDWLGKPVRAVFLVSIAKGHGDLQEFYHVMAALLMSERDVARLVERQDYETLASMLDEHCHDLERS